MALCTAGKAAIILPAGARYNIGSFFRGTPTLLYVLALLAIGAGGALVYLVPDDSAASVVAQLVGAGILVGAGGAAFFGGNFLSKLQN